MLLCEGVLPGYAQNKDSLKTAAVKGMLLAKSYIFNAQSVTSLTGRLRQLDNGYTLQVLPDTIIAQLPYFGRAYTAPLDPSAGGIRFTATQFSYTAKEKKKDRWEISIVTKDVPDAKQLNLTIFSNGNASLQVVSNNRQPIFFNGYISAGNALK